MKFGSRQLVTFHCQGCPIPHIWLVKLTGRGRGWGRKTQQILHSISEKTSFQRVVISLLSLGQFMTCVLTWLEQKWLVTWFGLNKNVFWPDFSDFTFNVWFPIVDNKLFLFLPLRLSQKGCPSWATAAHNTGDQSTDTYSCCSQEMECWWDL